MLDVRIHIGAKRIGILVAQDRADDRSFCLIGKERGCQMMPEDPYPSHSALLAYTRVVEHFLDVMPKGRKLNERMPVADKNLYWHFGGEASFNGQSIGEWRKATGKDLHSIIADPAFVNISSGDFRMQNKKALKRIGFKQFDWTQAGVSGSDEWENLAKYNPDKALSFDRIKSNVLTGD